MEKYYTPEIEEFHVGFEFETCYLQKDWIKKKLEFDDFGFYTSTWEVDSTPKTEFRVKYLDKEDIESLGWFHRYDDFTFGEYSREKTDQLNYQLSYDYTYHTLTIGIYDKESITFYQDIFVGDCKNKSELKKLLKQLQIN